MLSDPLRQALSATPPSSEQCQQIAHWRQSLGQARQAARWQRWSLVLPPDAVWREAVAALWLELDEPAQAQATLAASSRSPALQGWLQLEQLLVQRQLQAARELQHTLLASPDPLPAQRMLALAERWQANEQNEPALALLLALAEQQQAAGHPRAERLCNAIGHLLEQTQQSEAATLWWQRSLTARADQPAVHMRLARFCFEQQQPHTALEHLQAVLASKPNHRWALQLQLQVMLHLQAPASAQLALQQLQQRAGSALTNQQLEQWSEQVQALSPASEPQPLPAPPPEQLRGHGRILIAAMGDAQPQLTAAELDPTGGCVEWIRPAEPLQQPQQLAEQLGECWQVRSRSDWPGPGDHNDLLLLGPAASKPPASWQHSEALVLRCSGADRHWLEEEHDER
jgi:hypothetical protein